MKKLLLTLAFVLIVAFAFSQATHHPDYRVADTTTVFGVAIPTGSTIWSIANEQMYKVTSGIASTGTEKISNSLTKLKLINRWEGTDTIKNRVTNRVEIDTALTLSGLQPQFVEAGKQRVLVLDSATENVYYTTLEALLDSIFVVNPDSSLWNLSGDTVVPKNSYKVKAKNELFIENLYQGSASDSIVTWNPATGQLRMVAPGSLGGGTVTSITSSKGMSFDEINTSGSVKMGVPTDITNAVATSGFTGTGDTSHVHHIDWGTADNQFVTVDDAGGGQVGEVAVFTANGVESKTTSELGIKSALREDFIVAADDPTDWTQTLSQTPDTVDMIVEYNGKILSNTVTNDNWDVINTNELRVNLPVYQYDEVIVRYSY